eukprot:CAMPEP_0114108170 /NCGR_PEP_ID=MMETSP0043_2-20121206/77_1 /TAXON_ID=464988 /ORGANISM="Hemiselmis andersenii, Strain CCMP644" /LENGTH=103 /DNA_ID=CAMNT_0001199917 /DNA_START=128 /DNA_END=436 /DNA_ORIENTATION=-
MSISSALRGFLWNFSGRSYKLATICTVTLGPSGLTAPLGAGGALAGGPPPPALGAFAAGVELPALHFPWRNLMRGTLASSTAVRFIPAPGCVLKVEESSHSSS